MICHSPIAISLLLVMVRYGAASRVSASFFPLSPTTVPVPIALVALGETNRVLA
ncbi:hypothetical protein [Burkholderia sp. MSMB1835]|uniref:hypothetical protein n=1 Tax=Burkholderia sp. MSMB1835 TaxID=1637876 RepID=UPI000A7E3E9E